jgi:hypothetical protein
MLTNWHRKTLLTVATLPLKLTVRTMVYFVVYSVY